MAAGTRRVLIWLPILGLVAAALAFAFAPRPVAVDIVVATRGPLVTTVNADGETRIKDVFTLSAPVTGWLRRIELKSGAEVHANETIIARLEAADPAFLDLRATAELEAAIRAAEAAIVLADAEIERVQAELEYAEAEVQRARTLSERGVVPVRQLDEAERLFSARQAELASAHAAREMRSFELERAKAQLSATSFLRDRREACDCIMLQAPVDGKILRVHQESEGVVAAGTPLIDIGNPDELEVVADFLSQDAVRVAVDDRVIIDGWGGPPLEGVVATVEPWGFTKVSALGIEEQRVNVVIDFRDPRDRYASLGHGFAVDVRVIASEVDDVLKVPLTALFREEGAWALFAVEDGRAVVRKVETGASDGIETEIVAGLDDGEEILLYPSDRVTEGVRVTSR